MVDTATQEAVAAAIAGLRDAGARVVVVHGGGPFIQKKLAEASVESEFIEGHRVTTPEALHHIEMALKGEVNSKLVGCFLRLGQRAVGLSGKDGGLVTVTKRMHVIYEDGIGQPRDLGRVGEVASIDTTLLELLLSNGYLPVITCIAADKDGLEYNVNADLFAGHLAGALKADHFLILTDVDGLMRDVDDQSSLISRLPVGAIEEMKGSIIKGGMLPKIESCQQALLQGVASARIINGRKPEQIHAVIHSEKPVGTEVCR
jgi:acetylglutamate kinase